MKKVLSLLLAGCMLFAAACTAPVPEQTQTPAPEVTNKPAPEPSQIPQEEIDVLVGGGGGSGLAAAIAAQEGGASVTVLEASEMCMGSTGYSGGGIGGAGTYLQKEYGIEDSVDNWLALWKERNGEDGQYPDYDRVKTLIEEGNRTIQWLHDYTSYQYRKPEGFGVDPVERLHFPVEGGGAALMSHLSAFAQDKMTILFSHRGVKLILEDGRVAGVVAETPEGEKEFRAKKVILATGGFARNQELLDRFIPDSNFKADVSVAYPYSNGDGILMAEEAGAALYENPWVNGLKAASKVADLGAYTWDYSKIYVDKTGKRFVDEFCHYAIFTNLVEERGVVFLLADSSDEKLVQAMEANLSGGEVFKGETIEELAENMGIDPVVLAETVKVYNEGCAKGEDEFGKPAALLAPLQTGPFYAASYYAQTMGTFGGVKTDDTYRVLKEDGSLIENLYAVGECSNRFAYNNVYMSGSAVMLALTTGRIAGADAAK